MQELVVHGRNVVLVGKQGLCLKQRERIYQCCFRLVLLCCCEMWELIVVDEVRLRRGGVLYY